MAGGAREGELPGEIHLTALVVATHPGQRRLATMAFHIVRSLSCLMNSGERLKSINRIKNENLCPKLEQRSQKILVVALLVQLQHRTT
jgi:hypothetical protein